MMNKIKSTLNMKVKKDTSLTIRLKDMVFLTTNDLLALSFLVNKKHK